MVAGTWLVLEDLSLQIELYRGDPPPTLTPETPTQSVRGLTETAGPNRYWRFVLTS